MKKGIYVVGQLALSVLLTTVLCLESVVYPSVATATVYYVATTGSDANSGVLSQPFRTIAKGVSILQPGDTLYLRSGTYNERVSVGNYHIPSGTLWSNPITIAGYPADPAQSAIITQGICITTQLDGSSVSYLIFDNLTVRNTGGNAIFLSGNSHHIRVSNSDLQTFGNTGSMNVFQIGNGDGHEAIRNKVHGAPVSFDFANQGSNYGFYVGGTHMLIDGNEIYNNSGYGIHHYASGYYEINDAIIRNNVIYGNGFDDGPRGLGSLAGVIITSGHRAQFYNNLVYGNKHGVQIGCCSDHVVYNNTIYGNDGEGLHVEGNTNGIVRNNIVFGNGAGDIHLYTNSGLVSDHNLTTNPSFVNAAAHDFTLQSGSPAIDTGVTVSVVTTDIKGIARPQGAAYDIGASEYGKGSTPLPTPSNFRLISVSP